MILMVDDMTAVNPPPRPPIFPILKHCVYLSLLPSSSPSLIFFLYIDEQTLIQNPFCFRVTNQEIKTFFFTFIFSLSLSCAFQVIIIHSSDTDGRAILGRFQTTSQTNYDDIDVRANVESIVEFEPKLESFAEHLAELKTAQSRVYLLYAK
jgi:hypothetical protein